MRRLVQTILALILALSVAQPPADAADGLQAWVGRYPSENGGIYKSTIINQSLRNLLPAREYELLTITYAVETPIRAVGGYILAEGCMPHCCPCESVLLAIRDEDQAMVAFFYDGSKDQTRCYSTGPQPINLPLGVLEAVLEMHIPRMTRSEVLFDRNPWVKNLKCELASVSHPHK